MKIKDCPKRISQLIQAWFDDDWLVDDIKEKKLPPRFNYVVKEKQEDNKYLYIGRWRRQEN